MKISIFGCGNAGSAVAADLSLKGHSVTLVKSSNVTIHSDHYQYIRRHNTITLEEDGIIHNANICVSEDIQTAISHADVLIIFIQTNYHEDLIKRICKYLSDGQIVILEPGYLSTSFFLQNTNSDITIIEAESSPVDCRILEPGLVSVLFRNTCNPFGVYPSRNKSQAENALTQLGYPYIIIDSVVEAALHNPNLILHTIGSIFSVPRIEYINKQGGRYFMYREVFTPHVWNLVLALDDEKINVLKKLGLPPTTYLEACKQRNSKDDRSAETVFWDYANNSSPEGPYDINSRYVTEDISQGLVLLESLGLMLKVLTPVCSSLIDCASALYQKNFRANGRTVEKLSAKALETILRDSATVIQEDE